MPQYFYYKDHKCILSGQLGHDVTFVPKRNSWKHTLQSINILKKNEQKSEVISCLTFTGRPSFVIYSYNKSQRDTPFLKFILIKNSTCFGQIYCPSSGDSTLYTQQQDGAPPW